MGTPPLQDVPVLADLDRRVQRDVENELRRLSRRIPRLPDHVAGELRESLTRIGDRLLLSPARTYTVRFPHSEHVLGALFGTGTGERSEQR